MHFAVTTTFNIEGFKIVDYKGVVRGIIVRAPTIAQGFLGGLKSIIGGNIGAYTEMCEQAREQAYELMIQHAQASRRQCRGRLALRRLGCGRQSFGHRSALLRHCRGYRADGRLKI